MENKKQYQVLKQGIWAVFMRGIGALGILVLTIVWNRMMPAKEAGLYFLAATYLQLIYMLSPLGLDTAALKIIPLEIGKRKKSFLKSALLISVLGSAVITLFAFLFLKFYCTFTDYHFLNIFWLYIPMAIALTMNRILSNALFAKKQVVWGTFLQSGLVSWMTIFLFLCFSIKFGSSFTEAATAAFFASITVAIVGIYLLRKDIFGADYIPNKCQLIRFGLPFLTIALLNLLLDATDKFMLPIFDSVNSVAPYEAARQSVRIGELFLVSCNTVVAPRFAKYWNCREKEKAVQLLKTSSIILFILSLGLLAGFIFFGRFLMHLNNAAYTEMYPVLLILAIGQTFVLGTGAVSYFLMMTGKERTYRNCIIGCVITNILLNMIMIPKFGIIGAATATTISLTGKNVATFILAMYSVRQIKFGEQV